MNNGIEVQLIIDASLDYSILFQTRFESYTDDERRVAIKAVLDCAETLSRRFGHAADEYLYGSNKFSLEEAGELLTRLRRMFHHADAEGFHAGVTAVCALEAMAGLQFAKRITSDPAITMHLALRSGVFQNVLRPLVEKYRP